jgi:transporter family protein
MIGRRSWIFLILSGLCTGLSWICYFRALQLGPASSVAPIDKLSVVLVIICAWLFLGEHLNTMKVLGGSLITIGAIVIALA